MNRHSDSIPQPESQYGRSWRPLKRSLARPYFSARTTWTKLTPTQTRLQLSTWGGWSHQAQLTNLSTHFEVSSSKSACPITASMSIRCLLYTSDAADDLTRVDLGGRRII